MSTLNGQNGEAANGGAAEKRLFGVDWERLRRRIGAVKAVALILAIATFVGLVCWREKKRRR